MMSAKEWLQQRQHVLDLGLTSDAFRHALEQELQAEFTRRDAEKSALLNHVSDLVTRTAGADALLEANDLLRERIADLERGHDIVRLGTKDQGDPQTKSEETTVSTERYETLAKKCIVLERNLDVYRKSLEYAIKEANRYKSYIKSSDEYRARKGKKDLAQDPNPHELRNDEGPSDSAQARRLRADKPRVYGSHFSRSKDASFTHGVVAIPSLEPSYNLEDLEELALFCDEQDLVCSPHIDRRVVGSPSKVDVGILDAPGRGNGPDVPVGAHTTEQRAINDAVVDLTPHAHIASSQTTQDEQPQTPVPVLHRFEEDEEPVFISTRPVKGRRNHLLPTNAPPQSDLERGVSGNKVKQERVEESDLRDGLMHQLPLMRTNTLDLDEPGISVHTPRKRKRLEDASQAVQARLASLRENRGGRSLSMPLDTGRESAAQIDQTAVRAASATHVKREESTYNNHPQLPDLSQGKSSSELLLRAAKKEPRALQPISPNIRVLPRTSSPVQSKSKLKSERRSPDLGTRLAEDGEHQGRVFKRLRRSRSRSPTRKAESDSRLRSLLEGQTPQRQALHGRTTPDTARRTAARNALNSHKPADSHLTCASFPAAGPASNPDTPATAHQATPIARPSRPWQARNRPEQDLTPLRSRPFETLKITDFKRNPNYIGMHLSDGPVRDRGIRRCLPACTRPCCTTAFRAMAEAGARPTIPRGIGSSPPSSPPTANGSGEDAKTTTLSGEDHRTIRHHLGATYSRSEVDALPATEQRELLLQARARLLGEQHGRHKRVWERAPSPPGFWRMEMPTTQEMEEDRAEAERREKETVRERWEDARRGGGRWVFRDE